MLLRSFQQTASDPECKYSSTLLTLPQDTCLKGNEIAHCNGGVLEVRNYPFPNCTGTPVITSNPANTCLSTFNADGTQTFRKFYCDNTPTAHPGGKWTYRACSNPGCTSGCSSQTFKEGECVTYPHYRANTTIAYCNGTNLEMRFYERENCRGYVQPGHYTLDQCFFQDGYFVSLSCNVH